MKESKEDQLNEIVRLVFNGVTPDDLLRHDGKAFWVGNTQLSFIDAEQLAQQAVTLRSSLLWKLLVNNGTAIAIQRIATLSKNWEDVFFGKAMLYELDVMDKWLSNLISIAHGKTQEKGKEGQVT